MTRLELGDEVTAVHTEGDELVIERVFDAPRELVWTVMTSAEYLPAWLGPHGTTTEVTEWDLRPGGRWRWVNRYDADRGIAFHGEILEFEPPRRLVRTARPDGPEDGDPAVETLTLTELDHQEGVRTRVHWHTRFPSAQVLDFAVSTGMSRGIVEQFERMAELLARSS